MFEDFWYEMKEVFYMIIMFAFAGIILPSSIVFGFYLMNKISPHIVPICEVRK
jgi:hypothetical protein